MSTETPSRSPTLPGTPIGGDRFTGSRDRLPEPGLVSARLAAQTDSTQTLHDGGAGVAADLEKAELELAQYEVKFTGDDDPLSPRSIGTARKWLIVTIVATTSLCVAFCSSIYSETYGQLTVEFDCSEEVATLGLSMFVLGLAISPMLLGPLSEFYGRKPVYVGSLVFFFIWIIPAAVAQNIQTMIVVRFLDGFSGAAFLSVAGSTVSDLFPKHQLAAPMTLYTLSPFMGPQLGPIVGGFINYYLNWRWTFWILLIWTFVQTVLVVCLVPETYHPVLLRNIAAQKRKDTGDTRWWAPLEKMDKSVLQSVMHSCTRPFLLLMLEPMCLSLCLYCALILGILYLFFGAFPLVFEDNFGFNQWQVGLTFIGISVGMILASATTPLWNRNYQRLVRGYERRHGHPGSEPEYRLPPAIAGGFCITIGLFWFGWTTYASVPWIVPILGSAVFGAGTLLAFTGIWTFLVENYPLYAASALAANSFCRSSFAAAFPLFGNQMYENLGYQWASFLLAMISVVMLPFPIIFYKYAWWFRARSGYSGPR